MNSKARRGAYLVAGAKPWNRRIFEEVISKYPGRWHFIRAAEELTVDAVQALNPRYIFFLHWSWKVPDEIIKEHECVCFHMTDVPYGRGGSPLQNLVLKGHKHTKLTALRMVRELDAGPIYLKEDLCLESGSAEEIYCRATYKASEMIRRIVLERIEPIPQIGEPTIFKRRQPEESEIVGLRSLNQLYDFIRMLDAEGYPKAFIELKGFRFEFSRAALYNEKIEADVLIKKTNRGE
ncbi:MAG: methionyl-tRNA formyltransferase [Candidatus Hodarchaeota archaeon]